MADFRAEGKRLPAGLSPEFPLNLSLSVFGVCEERNQEARQKAQHLVPVLVRSFGYEATHRALKRLKPSSMDAVGPLLEKAREQVAAEDAEKGISAAATAAASADRPKAIRGGGGGGTAKKAAASPDEDEREVETPTG